MPEESNPLQQAAALICAATRITVLTGAGISAESGVPTFRDAQTGLWATYDPLQLATPEAFAADPERVWQWYAWRRELIAAAQPNPGHTALAAMEQHCSNFHLITQNVDGLHQGAGSHNIIELHGNIHRTRCADKAHPAVPNPDDTRIPPRCPQCDAPLRPDVVWFGEHLPAAALERAFDAAKRCDLFLCIGTSSLVYPAAGLPYAALEAGAMLIEINPSETPLSHNAHLHLRGPAGEILPRLIAAPRPTSEASRN
ncbi:MAG: NAD-dependent deacylase [Proteobacteria bacterium]|nr:MAG: NAD-dependent deacylase [Pseudomonadota bacterium]